MKNALNIFYLLALVSNSVFSQKISENEIEKIEIFAINPKESKGSYSPSENDLRKMKKESGVFFNKVYKKSNKVRVLYRQIESLQPCNYKGIIYPKIIIDFCFNDGHVETLIVGSLQNISYNNAVYKQNPELYKYILKLLPFRMKHGVKVKEPTDEFCN